MLKSQAFQVSRIPHPPRGTCQCTGDQIDALTRNLDALTRNLDALTRNLVTGSPVKPLGAHKLEQLVRRRGDAHSPIDLVAQGMKQKGTTTGTTTGTLLPFVLIFEVDSHTDISFSSN